MNTVGMYTYALVAVGADAVLSVVARHDRMITAGSAGEKPVIGGPLGPPEAGKRRLQRPLANTHSLRDNRSYRASFARRNRHLTNPWRSSMTTAASDPQIVPRPSASMPALRAADQGVASALESVLSNNTRRVYAAQWRIFENWCDSVGLPSLPAQPLTVARYLAVRAGDGAAVARYLAIRAKANQWAGHESPCLDRGARCKNTTFDRYLRIHEAHQEANASGQLS